MSQLKNQQAVEAYIDLNGNFLEAPFTTTSTTSSIVEVDSSEMIRWLDEAEVDLNNPNLDYLTSILLTSNGSESEVTTASNNTTIVPAFPAAASFSNEATGLPELVEPIDNIDLKALELEFGHHEFDLIKYVEDEQEGGELPEFQVLQFPEGEQQINQLEPNQQQQLSNQSIVVAAYKQTATVIAVESSELLPTVLTEAAAVNTEAPLMCQQNGHRGSSGGGPIICNIGGCKKSFRYPSQFALHERTHTREKPFKCGHCPKSFTQRSSANAHERACTGTRPFWCPFDRTTCTYSAAQRTNVRTHLMKHHKVGPTAVNGFIAKQ